MKRWKKPYNKFNNKRTICGLGHSHQSKHEAFHCNDLELLKKAKIIKDHKTQVPYVLHGFNGSKICTHYVDFVVYLYPKDGDIEIHECKSIATEKERDWINKMKMFKDEYPLIPYKVLYNK